MYKNLFNQRKALRFRQFTRKGWALFACLGRVVTIGVLSAATLQSATAAHRHVSTDDTEQADTTTAEKEATLDDIEVTGTRAPLSLGQAVRMVTVLSRDDIQAAPVQSINDLLKMAAGVDVRQRGPIGAQTDVGIRGGTGEQITILLNGINICDPQTSHNAFDLPCDLSDILRIEVLEGPAGRAFGTSSLIGAVNIVTIGGARARGHGGARARESWGAREVQARAEGGSFGYANLGFRYSLSSLLSPLSSKNYSRASEPTCPRTPEFFSTISTSYTRSDGYSRAKSGALNSDYQGAKAFYQGGYGDEHVRLNWHAGVTTKGFGSNTFYSARYDEQFEQTTKLFTALQGETTGWLHFRPAVYWNRSYDRFELIRGEASKVPFNHHRTDVFGINLNSYFDSSLGRTAFGAEFRNEDIVSSTLGEPRTSSPSTKYQYGLNRSNLSFHLEHNVLLRRFALSAGFIAVRNTWNQTAFTVYPGVDASLRLGSGLRLYASYNSSLRMPSFTELYYSVGGHKADKYLKPEELQAVEGGLRFTSPLVTAKAAVFHHHARNMIDWVMDTRAADPVWESVNHTRVNTLGEEVSVDIALSELLHLPPRGRLSSFLVPHSSLLISYCHLHQSKQEQPYLQSQYSLEYLRHKLTAQLRLQIAERLALTLGYRFQDRTGHYTDTDGETRPYRPYSILDSRLGWQQDQWSFYVEANNLTNRHYVDYGNVPQPGTWLMAGLSFRFPE